MTPRDVLGLLVRITGLSFILCSLFDVYWIVVAGLGLHTNAPDVLSRGVHGFAFFLIVGVLILLGAKRIVRLAYWDETPDRSTT
jgi:hypothetical protein